MKKVVSLFLCFLLVLSVIPAWAQGQAPQKEGMWQYILGADEYGSPYAILTGGASDFDSETLTIPLTLGGHLVREIRGSAVQVFAEAKEVILHESIQRIGAYAFAGLPKLEKVVIPENSYLCYIDDMAFANCRNLREITLPQNLLSIGEKAFSNCVSLKEMTIPKNVQTLSGIVFEYCDALEKLEVQCDYENLGLFVADCMNLKTVVFSGDIASVDENFGYNFFDCEERADPNAPRNFTKARDLTIIGKRNTPIEETAVRIGVPFVSLKELDEKTFKTQTAWADQLHELGLFLGSDNGYELDRPMTRAEAMVMLYRVLFMYPGGAAFNASHPFTDVPDWAYSAVACAYTGGLTYGISETEFGSDHPITVNQYLTMLFRAMGYDSFDFDWESPYGLATRLRMLPPEVNLKDFTRGDAVAITAAALFAPLKHEELTLGEKLATMGIYTQEELDRVFATNPFEAYYAKLAKIEEADLLGLTPLKTNQHFRNSAILFGDDLAYIVRSVVTINEESKIETMSASGWFYTVSEDGEVLEHHLDGVYDYWDYFPESANRELLLTNMRRWNDEMMMALNAAGVLVYQKPTHDQVLADFVTDGWRTCEVIHETDSYSLAEIWLGGTPHGSYASLYLVYKEGSALGDGTTVSLPLPQETFWGNTRMPDTMTFSEDGKTLVYTRHFDEKLEVSIDITTTPPRLVHDKGTYTYTVDLETGEYSLEIIQ